MDKKIILFLSPLRKGWKEQVDLLREEFPNVHFVTPGDVDNILDMLPEAEGIIPYRITAEQVQSATKLKIIFIPWSGTDSLPIDAVRESHCIIANTHGNASSVAEHAVTLALTAMHRIISYHQDLQKGVWHGFIKSFSETDQWMRLTGKRCAILGTGEIGSLLARILKAGFHCQVKGWKKRKVLSPISFFDNISTDLQETLKDSEIVFVTLPLTEHTRNLFHEGNINWLFDKVVVNVGRGLIFEEKALYQALLNNKIRTAGLDVWFDYPYDKKEPKFPGHYPFHTLSNIVMSPHIGGYSREGQYQMLLDTMSNIRSYLSDGHPIWSIQLDKGY